MYGVFLRTHIINFMGVKIVTLWCGGGVDKMISLILYIPSIVTRNSDHLLL